MGLTASGEKGNLLSITSSGLRAALSSHSIDKRTIEFLEHGVDWKSEPTNGRSGHAPCSCVWQNELARGSGPRSIIQSSLSVLPLRLGNWTRLCESAAMASTSADSEAGGAKAMMRSVSTGLQELGARVTQTIERYVSVGTGAGAMAAHSTRSAEDDEEALMWATLEKLPTYDRLRKTVLCDLKGSRRRLDTVDVRSLKQQDREAAIDNIIGSDAPADNEKFLSKLRERLEK